MGLRVQGFGVIVSGCRVLAVAFFRVRALWFRVSGFKGLVG